MKRLIIRIGLWLCRHGWHKNVPFKTWDIAEGLRYEFTMLEVEVCKRCKLIHVVDFKQGVFSVDYS